MLLTSTRALVGF